MIQKQFFMTAGLIAASVLIESCSLGKGNANKTPGGDARASAANSASVPTVQVTRVVSQQLDRQTPLPGDLQAYQDVALYPKVQGFVEWIGVDRGSVVRRGQPLVRMSAPELGAQRGEAEARARGVQSQRLEAESKVQSMRAQRLEAEAKLAADEATYKRLKAASATPGVVAGNDVEVAEKTVEADRARVRSWEQNEKAAEAQVRAFQESEKAAQEAARSVQDVEGYLRITAPFDGIITERNVHRGSFVGPASGPASLPMLRIQQMSPLRLVVPVPEADVGGVAAGMTVKFTVPAFLGETFSGVVRRIGHALDTKTRTMPVELDVANPSGRLSPGMFPQVNWPTRRPRPSLFVPPSAVATTTERTFVIRIRDGVTEWVDVKRGASMNNLVEVFGKLAEGDQVATRGTDELRPGTRVTAKEASSGR